MCVPATIDPIDPRARLRPGRPYRELLWATVGRLVLLYFVPLLLLAVFFHV